MSRVPIVVYLDLDPVPGSFHTQESCRSHIEDALKQVIPHYKPKAYVPPRIFGAPSEELLIRRDENNRMKALRPLAAFSNVDA